MTTSCETEMDMTLNPDKIPMQKIFKITKVLDREADAAEETTKLVALNILNIEKAVKKILRAFRKSLKD